MAAFLVLMLILSMAAHSSGNWCVCKKGGNDKVLQLAIDYACGNGADCNPTHQGGKCFNPDTVMDHCNYAVNSYYQNSRQAPDSCNFNGAAMIVTADPSSNGCQYPSTSGSGGTTVTAGGTNTKVPPAGSTTVTAGGTTASPYGNNNPTNSGVLGGGIGTGLGPSGAGINTDMSHGPHQGTSGLSLLGIMGLMMVLWG